MTRLVEERGRNGYVDMADLTRAGYWREAIETYLETLRPTLAQSNGDAA